MKEYEKNELEKYAIYLLTICVLALILLFFSQLAYTQSTVTHETKTQELRIAVAANFRSTLEKLIQDYSEHYHPLSLNTSTFKISSASTGVLYAQIKQGAPYDLFFSADKQTATKLETELKIQTPAFNYAKGLLAFWCPKGSPYTLNELAQWQGSFAIANPKLAPYGVAAQQVINKLNWKNQRTIIGNNVAQVAQFIVTENVQCGFLAQALIPATVLATVNLKPQVLKVPAKWYQAIEQYAVKLPRGEKNMLAKSFIQYIQNEGRNIIKQSGYALPSAPYAKLGYANNN